MAEKNKQTIPKKFSPKTICREELKYIDKYRTKIPKPIDEKIGVKEYS